MTIVAGRHALTRTGVAWTSWTVTANACATMTLVRRFVLAVILGLLTISASGAWTLVVTEPCAGYEFTAGDDDGACPPTCVTCGCCAQAVEPAALTQATSPDLLAADVADPLPQPVKPQPRDILHVPRHRLV